MRLENYYGFRQSGLWYRGIVYHYDESGNTEVALWTGPQRETAEQATDDAAEWVETQNSEACLE